MIRSLPKNGIPTVTIGDGKWGAITYIEAWDFIKIERVNDERTEFLYMLVREVKGEGVAGNILDAQNRRWLGLVFVPFKGMMEIEVWAKKSCFRLFYHMIELKDSGYVSPEQVTTMPIEEVEKGLCKMGLGPDESPDGFRN